MLFLIATGMVGCCAGPEYTVPPDCPPQTAVPLQSQPSQPALVEEPAAVVHPNPVFVPIADHEAAWEQTVDVVDDYFRIDHEEPVRIIGNEVTQGEISTLPQISPTIFEPWRHDTVDPEQRMENTLQTMRRRAVVHVIPQQGGGGHWVDVQIYKELENLPRPDRARAGTATFSYDTSFTRIDDPITDQPPSNQWIPRGRDASLEQHIINDLLCRSSQPGAPSVTPMPQ